MLRRMKLWVYLTVLCGGTLLQFGGCGGWSPWGSSVLSWGNIIGAILREELLS